MGRSRKVKQLLIVRFPMLYLFSCALLLSALLALLAVASTRRSLFAPFGSKTIQDVATLFSGTIGSGVALAGSIVAVYLALTALKSVQRQQLTDAQRFLDSYISEVYGIFVELSLSVDEIIYVIKQLLDSKPVRALQNDVVVMMQEQPGKSNEKTSSSSVSYEGALAHVDDGVIQLFFSQFLPALQRTANAIERVSASHKASSLWHYSSNTYGSARPKGSASDAPNSGWNPYEGIGIAGYDSLIRDGETIQGSALFMRSMAQGLSGLLQADDSTRGTMINLARSSLAANLIGAWVWRGAEDLDAIPFRGELSIIGILMYFGSPSLVRSMTFDHGDHNLSLLVLRSIMRGIPSASILNGYIREHFYESLIRDSDSEEISTKHFLGIENIGTPYSGLRRYLAQREDTDVLLAKTFMSAFTADQRRSK